MKSEVILEAVLATTLVGALALSFALPHPQSVAAAQPSPTATSQGVDPGPPSAAHLDDYCAPYFDPKTGKRIPNCVRDLSQQELIIYCNHFGTDVTDVWQGGPHMADVECTYADGSNKQIWLAPFQCDGNPCGAD